MAAMQKEQSPGDNAHCPAMNDVLFFRCAGLPIRPAESAFTADCPAWLVRCPAFLGVHTFFLFFKSGVDSDEIPHS